MAIKLIFDSLIHIFVEQVIRLLFSYMLLLNWWWHVSVFQTNCVYCSYWSAPVNVIMPCFCQSLLPPSQQITKFWNEFLNHLMKGKHFRFLFIFTLNDSDLAELKQSNPIMLLPCNLLGRCSWSINCKQLYLKFKKFCENVIFWAISLTFDILPITPLWKF